MRAVYLLSLARRGTNVNADANLCLANVAFAEPAAIPRSIGGPQYTNVFSNSPESFVEPEEAQCDALEGNATPPSVAAAYSRQHSRSRRVPDYDGMCYITPQETVTELWIPNVTVVEPTIFATPRPMRPAKVDRANISAIVDHEWEICGGRVCLQSTETNTVNDNRHTDNDSFATWPLLSPRRSDTTQVKSICSQINLDDMFYPVTNSPPASDASETSSETSWSLGRDAGRLDILSAPYGTPTDGEEHEPSVVDATARQAGDGPLRECDWIDCPFCTPVADQKGSDASYSTMDIAAQTAARRDKAHPKTRRRKGLHHAKTSARPQRDSSSNALSGRFLDTHAPRQPETRCDIVDAPSQRWGQRKDVPSCPRPCDWIDCPICEQAISAPTKVECKTDAQRLPEDAIRRKLGPERKHGRKEGGEFYKVAVMLGLVRGP
ncbi:uncharacterized protein B0H18DRAFT_1115731 [Fomitopsis serialis]|uniref:uncharacterized protein n=1 Tax=Fomitopsis serialis TaxID=139415 RepID=UPI0020078CC3|nr:uncharacterized protein B0H18DRAFT_1115731 [Neoantrodia serialis]KAH9932472.1 hypothetical protein B0H18DRAFT_1115731 [Neoantrodia serialis]